MNASGRLNTCKSRGITVFGPVATGERVRNMYATCPVQGNSPGKSGLIPHNTTGPHGLVGQRFIGTGGACTGLAGWWGNGSPRRRSIGVLRGFSPTLALRHGPDSYGRQQ